MKKGNASSDDESAAIATLTKETEAVKQLLMLLLAKLGSDSKEIGMALGVADSTVRKMISFRKVAKLEAVQPSK